MPRGRSRASAERGPAIASVVGVILAGGRATRMGGGDKVLLPLGGRTVLEHVIERLAPQVDTIALNANGDPGRFAATGLTVLPDASDSRDGPLAGVLAGLTFAASVGAHSIVTVAGDTPFFPADLVRRLRDGAGGDEAIAIAATADGEGGTSAHPTFACVPVRLRDDLETALGEGVRKILAWTDRHGTRRVVFDAAQHDPFFNINTPDDLAAAQALLDACAP